MKIKYIGRLFICLLVFSLYACENEEDVNEEVEEEMEATPSILTNINFISGVRFTNPDGNLIGQWRTPNDNRGNAIVFPNPVTENIILANSNTIVSVWFVKAECAADSLYENFVGIMSNVSYTREEVNMNASVAYLEIPLAANLGFDLSNLEVGLYRMFWEQQNGTILWSNIYKGEVESVADARLTLDSLCQ